MEKGISLHWMEYRVINLEKTTHGSQKHSLRFAKHWNIQHLRLSFLQVLDGGQSDQEEFDVD